MTGGNGRQSPRGRSGEDGEGGKDEGEADDAFSRKADGA